MTPIIRYADKRVYTRSSHVFIEPISLSEARYYISELRKAWDNQDIKQIKRHSYQILAWLNHGARIPDCGFKLYKKRGNGECNYGWYIAGDREITLWLEPCHVKKDGKWKHSDVYINTLIHEWIHHYCWMLFGKGLDHDLGFQSRLQTALRILRKELPKRKNKKREKT